MESNSKIVESWPDWMRGAPACPEHPGGCRSACIEKRKSAKVGVFIPVNLAFLVVHSRSKKPTNSSKKLL